MEAVTASVWVYCPIGPSIKTVSLPQNGLRAQRKTIGYNARVNYAYAITCNNNSLNWQKQVETGNLQNSTMDSFTAWTRLASIGNFCNLHTYSIGSANPLSIIFLENLHLVSISHLFCGSLPNPCAVGEPFLKTAARQLRWRIQAWMGRLCLGSSGCLGLVENRCLRIENEEMAVTVPFKIFQMRSFWHWGILWNNFYTNSRASSSFQAHPELRFQRVDAPALASWKPAKGYSN